MKNIGWPAPRDLKMDISMYLKNKESIIEFSNIMDKISFGCGFMLSFFIYSEKELLEFQNEYKYFPYDAYLDLWEEFVMVSHITPIQNSKLFNSLIPNYMQRNHVLNILAKKGFIIKKGDCYFNGRNPFNKIINRNKNLSALGI